MNVKGKLLEKFDTVIIKDNFQKREFVLEYAENPQYPEVIKFELIQSNCEQLDGVQVGDQLNVSFNLKGRKWTDPNGQVKYFNSLQAWRIESDQSSTSVPTGGTSPEVQNSKTEEKTPEWMNQSFSEDDDLPF